jgi:integrase
MATGVYEYTLADGSSRWRAVYRTSNGVLAQKRGFRGPREAQRWRTATLAAVHRGEVIATRERFAERFDAWLAEHRPRIEDGTYRDYRVHGDKRLKPFFGEMKPAAIAPTDVRRYVAELVAGGRYATKTINNSLVVLRLFLGHLREDGVIATNPAASTPGARERIKLPADHREMDYLRLEEIPRYLDACSATYRPLAEVLIACGLRISEALALTWKDLDLGGRSIRVLRSRKRGGDGSTKGDRFRSVDFGPRIADLLADVRAARSAHGPVRRADQVFVGPRGGRLNRSDVSRDDHKAALEDAALRTSLRLHDLRHTAAASWLACGLPLIYVQRQLGHASLSTTEALYGHLEEAFLRRAAERVEERIWGIAHGHGAEPAGPPAAAARTAAAEMLPRVLPHGG